MTTATAPTQKQIDRIIRLHNQLTGSRATFLSQTPYKGTKTQEGASRILDDLTAQATTRTEIASGERVDWTKGVDAIPPADQLLPMLGHKVTATTNGDFRGTLAAIVASDKDGTPALRLTNDAGIVVADVRLSKVTWFRLDS
jgi:hypothetical protein